MIKQDKGEPCVWKAVLNITFTKRVFVSQFVSVQEIVAKRPRCARAPAAEALRRLLPVRARGARETDISLPLGWKNKAGGCGRGLWGVVK